MLRRFALLAVLLLPMIVGLNVGSVAQESTSSVSGDIEVLAPDESYAGRTRAEWDAQAWQWIVSYPAEVNPGLDEAGERCGFGQSGPVYFLPGNFSPEPKEITCFVPEGMAIFVGLGGAECSTVEPPPFFGRTEEELTSCASEATDALVNVGMSINGQEVPDVMRYRAVTPMFTFNFPEDNLFGVEPGIANAVADSYSVIIAPLPPGEYEITVTTGFEDPPQTFVGTVNVIVQPAQVIEPQASPDATPMASPQT